MQLDASQEVKGIEFSTINKLYGVICGKIA
jgi:hypothetical protein